MKEKNDNLELFDRLLAEGVTQRLAFAVIGGDLTESDAKYAQSCNNLARKLVRLRALNGRQWTSNGIFLQKTISWPWTV
jgi:hypothetical protein